MRTYTCVDCGIVGETSTRGPVKRCQGCRETEQREKQRRSRARRRATLTFTCVDCGVSGEGRSDRQRCDECRAAHERAYHRDYNAENDPYERKPARTWTCVGCGATGTQAAKGNLRLRCDECKREAKAERMRADELPPTPCADCGVPVPRSGGARRRPFKRCPECAQAFKIGIRTHRRNAPGREYFTHREIFERDGWRCYLCGGAVDPDLAYPDPRSASLDHVVPLAADGLHTRANTACTHLECNVRKHAKIIQTLMED